MTARHGMGVESVTARRHRDLFVANFLLRSQMRNGNDWEAARASAVADWLLAAAKWSHIADAQARVEQLAEGVA